MAATVNLHYTGKNGSAHRFAGEPESSGTAESIRSVAGNLRREYFFPMNNHETAFPIGSLRDQAVIDARHVSLMMESITALREKNGLRLKAERHTGTETALSDERFIRR